VIAMAAMTIEAFEGAESVLPQIQKMALNLDD
jgi:hypothetical protein